MRRWGSGTSKARERPGAEDGVEAQHWSRSWEADPEREVTDEELDGATRLLLVRLRGRGRSSGVGEMGTEGGEMGRKAGEGEDRGDGLL